MLNPADLEVLPPAHLNEEGGALIEQVLEPHRLQRRLPVLAVLNQYRVLGEVSHSHHPPPSPLEAGPARTPLPLGSPRFIGGRGPKAAAYKLLLESERQEGRWVERRLKGFAEVKKVLEKMLQERYAPIHRL